MNVVDERKPETSTLFCHTIKCVIFNFFFSWNGGYHPHRPLMNPSLGEPFEVVIKKIIFMVCALRIFKIFGSIQISFFV